MERLIVDTVVLVRQECSPEATAPPIEPEDNVSIAFGAVSARSPGCSVSGIDSSIRSMSTTTQMREYDRVILCRMKTAISVPDDVFAQAEVAAAQLGVSRSAFFTTAARRWLRDLEGETITEQIDAALVGVEGDENARFLRDAARRLGAGDGEW